MRSRWQTAVVALGLVAGLTACGIPVDAGPEPLDFPPQYQNSSATATPQPETQASGELSAVLCLTREQQLVPVTRSVEMMPSPAELLRDLIAGATETESQEQGLNSALVGFSTITVAGTENGVAEVAVGDGLDGITDSTRLLIYGQIVCTLDAHPEIDGVWFSRDGQRLSVPQGNAISTDAVLTADDYAALLEPRR